MRLGSEFRFSYSLSRCPCFDEEQQQPTIDELTGPPAVCATPNRALASVKATLGPAFSTGAPAGDVEMEVEPVAEAGLPAEAKARVTETNKRCASLLSLSPFLLSFAR